MNKTFKGLLLEDLLRTNIQESNDTLKEHEAKGIGFVTLEKKLHSDAKKMHDLNKDRIGEPLLNYNGSEIQNTIVVNSWTAPIQLEFIETNQHQIKIKNYNFKTNLETTLIIDKELSKYLKRLL